MNVKKIISVFVAIALFVPAIITAVPANALTETNSELDYSVTTDRIFSSNTEEKFKTAAWSSGKIDTTAVIKSEEELQKYVSLFFESSIVEKYVSKYNDSFFKDNILLVNSLYQSCGEESLLKIESVTTSEKCYNVFAKWVKHNAVAESAESALFVQISVPQKSYGEYSVNWNISDETNEEKFAAPSFAADSDGKKMIEVENIMQYPELPTGCESVSLTILLNHLGYQVDKMTIVRKYLPKMDFYWYGGVYYGADFRTTFAGNPESEYAYGCYAPCITTTANNYFESIGSESKACDLTGTDFETLLTEYIDKDIPVLIWITSGNLHETMLTSVWTTPDGERVQWVAYEHCVVLTGYDMDNRKIYVSDPLVGNTSYDYDRLKQRYIDLGQQAVHIQTQPTQPIREVSTYGDVDDDGRITSADSLLILRQSVGLEDFDDVHKILAEVDGDDIITSADALEVLRYSVGLPANSIIGTILEEE